VITRRAVLLAPIAVWGQQSDPLIHGFHLLYNLRFAEARAIFLQWQRDHPSEPIGFIAEAASHLFDEFERDGVLTTTFFLDDDRLLGGIKGTPDATHTKAFEAANARARSLAEALLRKNDRDANALFAMTLAAGMRADYASLITKHELECLSEIRAADKYAQRLIAITPKMPDAYMALGAANYILACLPSYKRAMLWFGGLEGNKQRGMDQLAQAAQGGVYLGPYAKILLALACLREKRDTDAKRLMAELTAAFPESPLFKRERTNVERIAAAG
jgi:hypothetical protein